MKPVDLIEYPIKNSSAMHGIVLDPFGGSGTTLIACERAGRVCRMAEIEEKYCDVIVKRYIGLTGSDADVKVIREGQSIPYKTVNCYE